MANKISTVTRRNIFDFIQAEGFWWPGRLKESDFLSRLFDLETLPSHDSRFENAADDIWQHRVNNPMDWDDNWIFSDKRFNLLDCDDSIYLNFICEMIHPLVRPDSTEVTKLLQIFNDVLKEDNFELSEITRLGGRPVFAGRQVILGKDSIVRQNKEIKQKFNEEYITQQINLMESSIEKSPHVAIGLAKELVETCCKTIFEQHDIAYDDKWDLLKLMKETTKLLKLTPEDIPNETKGAESIKQILRSLTSVVQGIGEIRNQFGSGHGKDHKFKGLQPRHAKLAVGASSTLAIYLFESSELRI
ncbi:abortive infection family protein [Sphingobacterium corticibacter]|uniref:Abortive infection protein-like C-terminal domain-containing protein n=1 Tax=Sphingobacterium corticibacter TaxID=2171749 RepID=A0A2T8HFR2_9SPHI|nr:abortive infection family protein [Sphingobacterium corticibacter]PVH24281.1 hypothetical protein DC487_14440 [Sphingobacterium corticibacter]